MTAVTSAPDTEVRRSFSEVWFITIGHSLTHWYPATFYVLAPVIGNELGLSYPQIASITAAQALAGAVSNIPVKKSAAARLRLLVWTVAPSATRAAG